MNFTKTTLDNGMTLLMEKVEGVRSVSLGIWVQSGSRDEQPSEAGISHFLEHMLFKGTQKKSARELAVEMDSLAGEINAFTSKEGTTFYVKVLDDCLTDGINLLTDIFLHSVYPDDEIEREKGVIIEEIRMNEDSPEELVHDLFSLESWGGLSVGRPVLGSEKTISAITRDKLLSYVGSRYGANNTIISCAGNISEPRVTDLLNRAFSGYRNRASRRELVKPSFVPVRKAYGRDLSEAHVCLGFEGIAQSSDERYSALLLSTILGGGMSSRLFQEIREKRGLAYSVYSFLSSYMDAGVWGIYAGVAPEKASEVIGISLGEVRSLCAGISADEVARARTQLTSNVLLGLESTSRRMQNLANQEIYYGRYIAPDEVIASINSITLDDIMGLCERLTRDKSPSVVTLGQVAESALNAA